MTNRRNFLKNSALIAASTLIAGKINPLSAKATQPSPVSQGQKRIGLQFYSVMREIEKDIPSGLKQISAMGYTDIELAGFSGGNWGGYTLKQMKQAMNDVGLQVLSSHVNPPMHVYTASNKSQVMDYWKKTVEEHAAIDCPYLVQPGLPQTNSIEETKRVAEFFNGAGEIAQQAGLKWGYHNHDHEFAKVISGGTKSAFGRREKGTAIYQIFMDETDAAKVLFEMDVYWAVMGQQDPLEWMKKYGNRIQLLHIKDRKVLGASGMMNFKNIFDQHYANGNKDYFVELEGIGNGLTQMEGIMGCADYLKQASFAK
ncbi:MAG: sugar phosphate isomerase/epimerase [Massilibacteroides sp.]|nr:sugar phosphate isomerase/epimerase [Massilibacteroides sp.]